MHEVRRKGPHIGVVMSPLRQHTPSALGTSRIPSRRVASLAPLPALWPAVALRWTYAPDPHDQVRGSFRARSCGSPDRTVSRVASLVVRCDRWSDAHLPAYLALPLWALRQPAVVRQDAVDATELSAPGVGFIEASVPRPARETTSEETHSRIPREPLFETHGFTESHVATCRRTTRYRWESRPRC